MEIVERNILSLAKRGIGADKVTQKKARSIIFRLENVLECCET